MADNILHIKPWSIQLELTEGCNRRCSFCGIHSLYRDKSDMVYKFMTPDMAKDLAKDMCQWFQNKAKRLEFALQGEPLLNKNANKIIRNFRDYYPNSQLMMTSNMDALRKGTGFDSKKIWNLFTNGLDMLVADYYGEKMDMPYQEFFNEIKSASNVPIFDFYKDKPVVWGLEPNPDLKKKIVVIDNTLDRNIYRSLNNQAGNTIPTLMPPDYFKRMKSELPKMTRCQQPFREMSIKHDGAIPICCMDWTREHIINKFPDDGTLEQIWNNFHFRNIRHLLYNKRRDLLSPCDRCNYIGHKVGLLDDPIPDADILKSARAVKMLQDSHKIRYGGKYAQLPVIY